MLTYRWVSLIRTFMMSCFFFTISTIIITQLNGIFIKLLYQEQTDLRKILTCLLFVHKGHCGEMNCVCIGVRVWRRPQSLDSSSPWKPELISSHLQSEACSCSTSPGREGTRWNGQFINCSWDNTRLFLWRICSHHVVQCLCHTVVSGIEEVDLGALYGNGAATGDLHSHLQSGSHHGLLVCEHSAGGDELSQFGILGQELEETGLILTFR